MGLLRSFIIQVCTLSPVIFTKLPCLPRAYYHLPTNYRHSAIRTTIWKDKLIWAKASLNNIRDEEGNKPNFNFSFKKSLRKLTFEPMSVKHVHISLLTSNDIKGLLVFIWSLKVHWQVALSLNLDHLPSVPDEIGYILPPPIIVGNRKSHW